MDHFSAAVQGRTRFAPAEMLLIDDMAENIAAARAAAWGGLHWTRIIAT